MDKPKLPKSRTKAHDAAAASRRTAKAASAVQAAVLGRAAEGRARASAKRHGPDAALETKSVAVPVSLLRAARERTGLASDPELVRFALSLLAESDSGEEAFNAALGSLPGHDLEY